MARALRVGLRDGSLRRGGLRPGLGGGSLFTIASLDLRFAEQKTLDSRITFTRASSGTFVNSAGVIQTAVTNLLLRSEEFDSASWTKTASSVTVNATTAPNGTLTADRATEDNTANNHIVQQNFASSVTGITYTFSTFLKAGERSFCFLIANGPGTIHAVSVNLTTGVAAATGVGTPSNITSIPFGNGWYRISFVYTSGTTGGVNHEIRLSVDGVWANRTYTGDGTNGIYIWGAQLEQSSTVGEYIPTTSTINSAPRFDHNPTTGESLGLLVEEQRTNITLQSNGFDTSWTNTESVETANQATAPDGTNSGWKLVNTAVSQSHNIFQSVAWTAVTTTVSVFVKYLDHRWVGIRMGAAGNQFFGSWDLQNSVVGSVTAGATIGMQAFGNGWYRLTLTATLTLAGGANLIIGLNNADAVALTTYTGTGTGIYIFGAQIEAGAFPTSYIPTTTATATRSADVASITGTAFSSWYRQDEGTVFAESAAPSLNCNIVGISDGTGSNRVLLDTGTNNKRLTVTVGGVAQAGLNRTYTYGVVTKTAAAVKQDSFQLCEAGSLATEDTSGTMPAVDRLNIGSSATAQLPLNGTIKRLTYWPTRLANSTLQEVTR